MTDTERNQRIVDLVCAKGTSIQTSALTGNVVVVDGRTGLDASERTAAECFDTLFAEQDGEGSPSRLYFTVQEAIR